MIYVSFLSSNLAHKNDIIVVNNDCDAQMFVFEESIRSTHHLANYANAAFCLFYGLELVMYTFFRLYCTQFYAMVSELLLYIFIIGYAQGESNMNDNPTTSSTGNANETYLTVEMADGMGIGNQMFIYAAMYGLAKTNNKTPIIKKSHPYLLKEFLEISIPERDDNITFVTVR